VCPSPRLLCVYACSPVIEANHGCADCGAVLRPADAHCALPWGVFICPLCALGLADATGIFEKFRAAQQQQQQQQQLSVQAETAAQRERQHTREPLPEPPRRSSTASRARGGSATPLLAPLTEGADDEEGGGGGGGGGKHDPFCDAALGLWGGGVGVKPVRCPHAAQ